MNRLAWAGRDEGRRAPAVPPDRRAGGRRDRGRLARRGGAGGLDQRAGRLPPHQPGHRGQGHRPARRGRGALQETGDRHVRRDRCQGAAAGAAPRGVHAPVPGPADGGGAPVGDRRRPGQEADRRLGGGPVMNATAFPEGAAPKAPGRHRHPVSLSGVSKRYREVAALDGVSIELTENTIHGLLGRNGAGKTTLMHVLTGQAFETAGTVRVFGEHPYENAGVLRRVCFIKESQRYPDWFAVRHALQAAALLYPGWDETFATRLVADFDLPLDRRIKKLSRGQ